MNGPTKTKAIHKTMIMMDGVLNFSAAVKTAPTLPSYLAWTCRNSSVRLQNLHRKAMATITSTLVAVL